MNQFNVSSELLARYILNRQKDLITLKQGLLEKDFSIIARKAHNMKGSAESFGFPELGFIGDELESAALDGKESEVQGHIKQIEVWLEQHI